MCKFCNDDYTHSSKEDTKRGALCILQVIDDGVSVLACKVFLDTTKTTYSHAFVHDSHQSQKEMI